MVLAEALLKLGHAVRVVTASRHPREEMVHGIPVTRVRTPLQAKPLFERVASARIARDLRPYLGDENVIHAHDFRSVLALAHLPYTHTVATVRDYAQICGSTSNMLADGQLCADAPALQRMVGCHRIVEAPLWRKPFRMWQFTYNLGFRKYAFQKIAHQVFISNAQRIEIMKHNKVGDARVIANPVLQDWLDAPVDHGKPNTIVFVGRLETTKGVDTLLHAFVDVVRALPDVRLHLVGGGEQSRYTSLARRCGIAHACVFHGSVPYQHIRTFYDRAQIVVQPSYWLEPFGRTAMEAMSRGKPVVASRAGGLPEIIDDGKTGLLVPRGEHQPLAEALIALLRDPERCRQLGVAGREVARRRFAPHIIARQYEELYRSLARG